MKVIFKKVVPKFVKYRLIKAWKSYLLRKDFQQDYMKFKEYSFDYVQKEEKRHHEADLIFYYHKIEKGLALPEPRVGFGKNNIKYLLDKLQFYVEKYGWDDISKVSLNNLYAYYYFNKKNNLDLSDLYSRLQHFNDTLLKETNNTDGGALELTKSELDCSAYNFKEFANSRYSIRDFASGEVSLEIIKEAVQIAQKTPSVCNRQSSKVYVYNSEKIKKEILKYQNGNAGFGERADKILLVTSELKDFRGVIERNQGYIDGGMYSMSLIYALHSLGVGTCPLNMSITNNTEKNIKKVGKIGDSEVLLMMIAVGHLPEKLKVAASPRRRAEEVMTVY